MYSVAATSSLPLNAKSCASSPRLLMNLSMNTIIISSTHVDDVDLFDNNPADIDTDSSSESDTDDDNDNHNDGMHAAVTDDEVNDVIENERIRQEMLMDNEMHQETDEQYVNPVDQHKPDDLYVEMPIDHSPQHRYPTRSKGPAQQSKPFKDGRTWVNTTLNKSLKRLKKAIFHASLTVKQKNKFGVYTNMTVRQAIDKYGEKARKAVMDELKQLIKLKVLKFVKADQIDPIVLKSRSSSTLKDCSKK